MSTHRVPVLDAHLEDRRERAEPGGVEAEVEAAEALYRAVGHRRHRGLVADVHLHRGGAPGRQRRGVGQRRRVDVGDHHLGALVEQPAHDGEADAGCATGDGGDLPLEAAGHHGAPISSTT
jgi:hypothetical protein